MKIVLYLMCNGSCEQDRLIVSKSRVVMAEHPNWNGSEKLTNSKLKLETPQE